MTEQPRESLADLLRAVAGATRREAERCEMWSPLAAQAWRVRAKRLRKLTEFLDATPESDGVCAACKTLDWREIEMAGEDKGD